MLPGFCRQAVTVVRPARVTRRGVVVDDWEGATRREIAGCSLQPGSTATARPEPREALGQVATLYAPPGADVRPGDRVEAGGATWAVSGWPTPRRSPFGALDHVRVELERWAG